MAPSRTCNESSRPTRGAHRCFRVKGAAAELSVPTTISWRSIRAANPRTARTPTGRVSICCATKRCVEALINMPPGDAIFSSRDAMWMVWPSAP